LKNTHNIEMHLDEIAFAEKNKRFEIIADCGSQKNRVIVMIKKVPGWELIKRKIMEVLVHEV